MPPTEVYSGSDDAEAVPFTAKATAYLTPPGRRTAEIPTGETMLCGSPFNTMLRKVEPGMPRIAAQQLYNRAMEPLDVCVVQMAVDDTDVSANARKIAALSSELDGEALDLVLLPELCDFGYDLPTIRDRFDGDESPAVGAMRAVAATLECFVAGGVVEREGDSLYDSLVVIGPEGNQVACYRKIQLFGPGEEKDVFEAGSRLQTFPIGNWSIGLAVCNDLRYPEIARGLTVRGIDVLVLSAAWPFPRVRHFTTLLEARAIENQIYVVASNRVGRTGDTLLCGSSRILDPHGDIVSSASEDKETLIRATLDPSALEWVRRRPGWKERRVDFDS